MPHLNTYPVMDTTLPDGAVITFRQARGTGAGTVVLLHGIGSNSGSWLAQLAHGLNAGRVLAWDAPGYGCSTAVTPLRPAAHDYAARLWQWLDVLGVFRGEPIRNRVMLALAWGRAALALARHRRGLRLF